MNFPHLGMNKVFFYFSSYRLKCKSRADLTWHTFVLLSQLRTTGKRQWVQLGLSRFHVARPLLWVTFVDFKVAWTGRSSTLEGGFWWPMGWGWVVWRNSPIFANNDKNCPGVELVWLLTNSDEVKLNSQNIDKRLTSLTLALFVSKTRWWRSGG